MGEDEGGEVWTAGDVLDALDKVLGEVQCVENYESVEAPVVRHAWR